MFHSTYQISMFIFLSIFLKILKESTGLNENDIPDTQLPPKKRHKSLSFELTEDIFVEEFSEEKENSESLSKSDERKTSNVNLTALKNKFVKKYNAALTDYEPFWKNIQSIEEKDERFRDLCADIWGLAGKPDHEPVCSFSLNRAGPTTHLELELRINRKIRKFKVDFLRCTCYNKIFAPARQNCDDETFYVTHFRDNYYFKLTGKQKGNRKLKLVNLLTSHIDFKDSLEK